MSNPDYLRPPEAHEKNIYQSINWAFRLAGELQKDPECNKGTPPDGKTLWSVTNSAGLTLTYETDQPSTEAYSPQGWSDQRDTVRLKLDDRILLAMSRSPLPSGAGHNLTIISEHTLLPIQFDSYNRPSDPNTLQAEQELNQDIRNIFTTPITQL